MFLAAVNVGDSIQRDMQVGMKRAAQEAHARTGNGGPAATARGIG